MGSRGGSSTAQADCDSAKVGAAALKSACDTRVLAGHICAERLPAVALTSQFE